jgi:hypothetical protein
MAKEMIALGFQYVTLLADNAFLAVRRSGGAGDAEVGGRRRRRGGCIEAARSV